ncbi:hypothetical protein EVAR_96529_1 [Eumeta japonica]|uniref:Uncharacterized protein n=1 Tax=Eumeta variegata TaxID=151549 RepID=A0A4C1WFE4_EUMVA|nr:hypothetical protein EVAR_96529_1 [Eumeta japonica]
MIEEIFFCKLTSQATTHRNNYISRKKKKNPNTSQEISRRFQNTCNALPPSIAQPRLTLQHGGDVAPLEGDASAAGGQSRAGTWAGGDDATDAHAFGVRTAFDTKHATFRALWKRSWQSRRSRKRIRPGDLFPHLKPNSFKNFVTLPTVGFAIWILKPRPWRSGSRELLSTVVGGAVIKSGADGLKYSSRHGANGLAI